MLPAGSQHRDSPAHAADGAREETASTQEGVQPGHRPLAEAEPTPLTDVGKCVWPVVCWTQTPAPRKVRVLVPVYQENACGECLQGSPTRMLPRESLNTFSLLLVLSRVFTMSVC